MFFCQPADYLCVPSVAEIHFVLESVTVSQFPRRAELDETEV